VILRILAGSETFFRVKRNKMFSSAFSLQLMQMINNMNKLDSDEYKSKNMKMSTLVCIKIFITKSYTKRTISVLYKVSKNLARYRSEINFVGLENNCIEHLSIDDIAAES